jgi:hypothetical protein
MSLGEIPHAKAMDVRADIISLHALDVVEGKVGVPQLVAQAAAVTALGEGRRMIGDAEGTVMGPGRMGVFYADAEKGGE